MLEWVLPFPSPGDLSDPGIKSGSPALQADSFPSEHQGSPRASCIGPLNLNEHRHFSSSGSQSFSATVPEMFRKCFSLFEACHIRCRCLQHHIGMLAWGPLPTPQALSSKEILAEETWTGSLILAQRHLLLWALQMCVWNGHRATPTAPSTVEWGRSGPRQTVTSLNTSRKEASTGFRDRKARAGILEPPDALLAEDP